MSYILTIVIETRPGSGDQIAFFASDGLVLERAIAAAEATIRALRNQVVEREVERRLHDARPAPEMDEETAEAGGRA